MLIRIWRVNIVPERIGDLEDFANTYSLPMFRMQAGCLGVLFTRDGYNCAVISIWENMQAIEKLKASPSYNDTVEKIADTRMLEGEQSVEIFEAFGGFLGYDEIAKSL